MDGPWVGSGHDFRRSGRIPKFGPACNYEQTLTQLHTCNIYVNYLIYDVVIVAQR